MSTNWPDLTLSTILRGKGSAAGDSIRPDCVTVVDWVSGAGGTGGVIALVVTDCGERVEG